MSTRALQALLLCGGIAAALAPARAEDGPRFPKLTKAGLPDEVINGIRDGRRPAGMQPDEAVVYDVVTSLLNKREVPDDLFLRAKQTLGDQQVVDLVAVTGFYVMVSAVVIAGRVGVPDGGPPPMPVWSSNQSIKRDRTSHDGGTNMSTRRSFLGGLGATTMAFCSCCMLDAARAQTPTPARLPVSVDGKRVKTVDAHAHCYFLDALELMGVDAQAVLPATKGVQEHFLQADGAAEARLKSMDDMGVDMEVLSINPYWYGKDRDTAAKIVKLNNDHMAELCAAHPDRFGGFAGLTLQYPELAVQQLEAAMKAGLRGAAIGASVLGDNFSQPKYHPVWAKAQELGAVLFIHPVSPPEIAKRVAGNGWLSNVIGNPLDTTLALQHLIFEGTLDRFPTLKVLAAHGGGYLPSYAPRSDHGCFVSPQNCNPAIVLKKQPTEYLNQLHFDALVFTPEALRHLAAQVGASQIVLGTDFPIPWEEHPVDLIFATATLSDEEKTAILGGNAARLFDLPA